MRIAHLVRSNGCNEENEGTRFSVQNAIAEREQGFFNGIRET